MLSFTEIKVTVNLRNASVTAHASDGKEEVQYQYSFSVISTLRLDEGVSEAPAGFHVHWGHVDLNEVMSVGGSIASRGGRASGDERCGGTPSTAGRGW